jgi:hypothetical protein
VGRAGAENWAPFVAAVIMTKPPSALCEPVSAPPKWKLKNGDQRPTPKARPARTEMAKIAGQRLGHANLTRGNVADSHTPRNNTPETRPPGWGGRIRTSAWRNQNPLPYRLATPQCRFLSHAAARGGQTLVPAGQAATAVGGIRPQSQLLSLQSEPLTGLPSAPSEHRWQSPASSTWRRSSG